MTIFPYSSVPKKQCSKVLLKELKKHYCRSSLQQKKFEKNPVKYESSSMVLLFYTCQFSQCLDKLGMDLVLQYCCFILVPLLDQRKFAQVVRCF